MDHDTPFHLEVVELELGDRKGLPADPLDWLRELGGPVLLRVPGRDRSRVRALTTLLHGNEPSGFRAVHAWLAGGARPAVDALVFLGAVEAALANPPFSHRFLPGHRDLNRCFRAPFEDPEGRLAEALIMRLIEAAPEALVDVHNNTGHNPPYGVGPRAGAAELGLTALFGTRYVHSDLRLGAIIEATQARFPSVTVECGRSGDPAADAVALAGLERLLALEALVPGPETDSIEILSDPVRVCVARGRSLAFGDGPGSAADLTVSADVDRHNFECLPRGTVIGWLGAEGHWPVEARGPDGRDLSQELFVAHEGRLETRCELVPIMMTTHPTVALADCLFYAVQPPRR